MSASRGLQTARALARLVVRQLTLAPLVVCAAMTGVLLSAPARTVAEARVMMAAYGQMSPVGALFAITGSDQLGDHFCTGTVVHSSAGDLVITAAHCVRGHPAARLAFVPDYRAGNWPDGIWTVTKVIVDEHWQSGKDPDDDFAFLTVRRPGSSVSLEAMTGGEAVAVGVQAGKRVVVAGYPDTGDNLVSCDNTARAFGATQFRFTCSGFTDGTSGGPLLADISPEDGLGTVIGVIGGYQQGGKTASVSYAARFSGALRSLYQRALAADKHR